MNLAKDYDEEEIDIGRLLHYYVQHWVSLITSGILVALAAFLVTHFLLTPKYQASVTVYVNNTKSAQSLESITGTNLNAAQQLVNTYVNIIKSDTVLDEVIEKGKFDCTAYDIRKIMSAEQVDDTEMFTVSISHRDGKIAAHIANTIAAVAPDRISGFVKGSSTEIIDYAKVPEKPYTPSYPKNIVLGGMLGVVLMGAYLTFRYLFDMRIKDEEELAMYFNVPILGVIPECDGTEKHRTGYYAEAETAGKGGR